MFLSLLFWARFFYIYCLNVIFVISTFAFSYMIKHSDNERKPTVPTSWATFISTIPQIRLHTKIP